MLDIQKEYSNEYIVYVFIGSMNKNDVHEVENMIRSDMNQTYAFIFSFRYLNYIDSEVIEMLKKIFLLGVDNACEIIISGLNIQPSMMLEIFKLDRLFTIKKTLKDATEMFDGDGYDLAYSN